MRVVVASEHVRTLGLVADMVEEEPGVVVVGEARNALETFGLVDGLRPDVIVVDSDLPYSVGLNATALSRLSGLDTAQTLAENMPTTPVVLLSNLAATQAPASDGSLVAIARQTRPGDNAATIIRFSELTPARVASRSPIFAEIDSGAETAREESDEMSEGSMLLGGGGALAMLFGLTTRLATRVWHARKRRNR